MTEEFDLVRGGFASRQPDHRRATAFGKLRCRSAGCPRIFDNSQGFGAGGARSARRVSNYWNGAERRYTGATLSSAIMGTTDDDQCASYGPTGPTTGSGRSRTGEVEIRELGRGEEGEWDRFVTSSPSGTFFHLLGWRAILAKTLGHQCFYLVARRQGRISRRLSGRLDSQPAVWRLHGLAAAGGLRRDLRGRSGFLFRPAESGAASWRSAWGEIPGDAQPHRAVCDLSARQGSLRDVYAGPVARAGQTAAGAAARYAVRGPEIA